MANPSTNPADVFVGFILAVIIFTLPWLITLVKKKRQAKKIWHYPKVATVLIKEKELKCAHCGHNEFSKNEGLLTTSWMTFFHLAYWNRSCSCFICASCSHIHWFHSSCEKVTSKKTDF